LKNEYPDIFSFASEISSLRKENLKVKPRIFFISLVFITATVIFFAPTHSKATQSATIWAWCMSDTSAPTVYFGGPFDSGITAKTPTFNALSLGRQFAEYIKGRFDTKGDPSSVTTASCGHGVNSVDQAAASQRMREVMAQLRQQNKQVLEVSDWNYIRDEVAIRASFNAPRGQGDYVNVEGGLPPDHMYCVTDTFNNTVYYADLIKLTNPSINPSRDYFRFLQQKYSYKGNFNCSAINEQQAKLYLNARLAGARAGGKQVVSTGWPPADFRTTTEAQNDRYKDNDQPAQRPNANQPTRPTQAQAINAISMQAAASCSHDPAMGRVYSCNCLQVKIHDYLAQHPAEILSATPTAASLLGGTAYQPETCINDPVARTLARETASSAGFKSPAALNCAAEKFVAALHANPVPSKAQAELDGAIKACKQ
jgi:hypothetical protein